MDPVITVVNRIQKFIEEHLDEKNHFIDVIKDSQLFALVCGQDIQEIS